MDYHELSKVYHIIAITAVRFNINMRSNKQFILSIINQTNTNTQGG